MIAPLVGESRVVGTIVVANRLSDISTFDLDELHLFETLASHTAIALENGQLEQSLAQLSDLKEELHHQAFHDSLTGLANRSLFIERVAARIAQPDPAGSIPVVLFLDLDDFKLVNDTLGHAAGDALLRAVGERIRLGLRADDVAARLGGDEFAILVSDTPDLTVATPHRQPPDRLVRVGLPARNEHGQRPREHRRRRGGLGHRHGRRTDAQCRRRDVPGQGAGQGPRRRVRAAHGHRRRDPPPVDRLAPARRRRRASSSSTTSRSSRSSRARSWASSRSCAGRTRRAAPSGRSSSSRSPSSRT